MAVQITDPIIISLIGLCATTLTVVGAWMASHHQREANLLEKATAQVTIILDQREKQVKERDDHIDELKSEVIKLNNHVDALIKVMRAVLIAGTSCPGQHDGTCPLVKVDLEGAMVDVLKRANMEMSNAPLG